MSSQTCLLPNIVVHCCFCRHVVTHHDPDGAHDQMENHYATVHGPLVARLADDVRP